VIEEGRRGFLVFSGVDWEERERSGKEEEGF
jgi:hypothetical protein